MSNGRVHPEDPVFALAQGYDVLPPPSQLTHRLPLVSAHGPQEPRFTNYTMGFTGVLDYIFFTKNHIQNLGHLALPEEEVVNEFTALPSPRFPSDHLCLVADCDWLNS